MQRFWMFIRLGLVGAFPFIVCSCSNDAQRKLPKQPPTVTTIVPPSTQGMKNLSGGWDEVELPGGGHKKVFVNKSAGKKGSGD